MSRHWIVSYHELQSVDLKKARDYLWTSLAMFASIYPRERPDNLVMMWEKDFKVMQAKIKELENG